MARTSRFPRVIRQAVSVSVATGLYGISFGALAITAGLTLWQTMALSMVMFSGASQFAVVGVIGAGGTPIAAAASAALLGIRNGLYGLQNGPILQVRGWRRLAAAQLTIDESTAVAAAQDQPAAARTGFWWTGAGVWLLWNGLTLVGALAGQAMGDLKVWGLDAAASAAFLGLMWPRLTGAGRGSTRLAAPLAAGIAVVLVPVSPPGIPVLGAACAAIVVGLRGRPRALELGESAVPTGRPGPDQTGPDNGLAPSQTEPGNTPGPTDSVDTPAPVQEGRP